MAPLPKVFVHDDPFRTVGPALEAALPYSLPVLRRIQCHLQTAHRVVFATFSPDHPPKFDEPASVDPAASNGQVLERGHVPRPTIPFAVYYADRSRYPETESWIFSTADLPSSPFPETENFAHILSVIYTASLHPRLTSGLALAAEKHVDSTAIKCGAIHKSSLRLMIGATEWDARHEAIELGYPTSSDANTWTKGNRSGGGIMRGYTVAILKYVYAPLPAAARTNNSNVAGQHNGGSTASGLPALPDGFTWATKLSTKDYETVVTKSAIRRRPDTLAMTPSCAVRDETGKLIGWVFCSPDGSFATLHVMPEFRGRGIARLLIRGLMASMPTATVQKDGEKVLAFEGVTPETAWTHSDTVEENVAAQSVLGKSGGTMMWKCYWTFIDLSIVQRLAQERMAHSG